jgi:hypothetical protein
LELIDREGVKHPIMAYKMEKITANAEFTSVEGALKIFPAIPRLASVYRPHGPVDLLIGIQYAALHPWVADRDQHMSGQLRLLTSKFRTGYLLDGYHPSLSITSVSINDQARKKGRVVCGQLGYVNAKPKVSHAIKGKPFTFPEIEEMGVDQPRRCGSCRKCSECSERSQSMTRREQEELGLIEKAIEVKNG